MLHAPPISVFLTWSSQWYLLRIREHKAPCHVVFSTPSSPHPSWARISINCYLSLFFIGIIIIHVVANVGFGVMLERAFRLVFISNLSWCSVHSLLLFSFSLFFLFLLYNKLYRIVCLYTGCGWKIHCCVILCSRIFFSWRVYEPKGSLALSFTPFVHNRWRPSLVHKLFESSPS
jgi:hypothetical protein